MIELEPRCKHENKSKISSASTDPTMQEWICDDCPQRFWNADSLN